MEVATAPLRLDGATTLIGIIGDPVAQVKAPQPLSLAMQARGLNAVLVPIHVHSSRVRALLDSLLDVQNFSGLIVTVPHKQLVAGLTIEVSPGASQAQAVNVVRRTRIGWQADLLDGVGFVDNLRAHGVDPAGQAVAIAGAGGAGNAIAFALAAAGAASIGIHDLDTSKQDSLVARLRSLGHSAHEWDGVRPARLLVNATPAGMRSTDALPMDVQAIQAGCVVADVIMEPHMTALLELAQRRGARVVPGRGMMEQQLARMVEFFGVAISSGIRA